ncbi:MAG: Rha family transcriptional regulator [Bacteroidales bacterium]|nr:Rha family transcriptional regulator [Bacteroidales bacterium]
MLEYINAERVCETQLAENDFSRKFMTSLEIAEVARRNHKDVMRSIREMEHAWEEVNGRKFALVDYIDKKGELRPCYQFAYEEFLYVISKFDDTTRAKLVVRWAKLETGQAAPIYQVNTTTQPKTITLKDQMMWVKEVSKVLKLNGASTLGLYQKVAEPHGQQLPLPDYTPSKGVLKSASELLKANNISMSAHQFNIAMMKAGYIEEQTRKSNGGKEKRFKSITKKGLEFGENQVSPHNPHETQPLYYVDKFGALVKKLQLN